MLKAGKVYIMMNCSAVCSRVKTRLTRSRILNVIRYYYQVSFLSIPPVTNADPKSSPSEGKY